MIFNILENWKSKIPFNFVEQRLTVLNNVEQFGVFAKQDINKFTLIDVCRLILIDRNIITNYNSNDIITDYWFNYNSQFTCIALGNGCIYNHSNFPNVKHYFEKDLMFIYSILNIKKDDELFINYGKNLKI